VRRPLAWRNRRQGNHRAAIHSCEFSASRDHLSAEFFRLKTMKWPVRQRQISPLASTVASKLGFAANEYSGVRDRRALAHSTIRARLAQVGFRR